MRLAQTIYQLRIQKGMSQGDLAEALEVSRQSVSKWETGGATPDLDKLVKMSELFGVTLDELVTGESAGETARPEPQVIYVERERVILKKEWKLHFIQMHREKISSKKTIKSSKNIS